MKWPLWHRHQDRQLDDELRSHLELAIRIGVDRGESPEQAADAARREFGNVLLLREEVTDTWGWKPIEHFWQDLGYARSRVVEGAGIHHCRGLDAQPWCRREHCDVQRRAGRDPAAFAICRSRSARGGE